MHRLFGLTPKLTFIEFMMQEVNPAQTTRAYAFEMWMKAPMPMVTLFRTLDVSNILRISRRREIKFNLLMCWSSEKQPRRSMSSICCR